MKIKLLISFICCLFYLLPVHAQRRNIYLYKNNGVEVKTRDSADYIRIVSEPDAGSTLYNVSEFYVNNTPKLLAKSSQIEYLYLEGQAVFYYPSGKKQELANYKDGSKLGDCYEYYPNGKLYTQKQYLPSKTNPGSDFDLKFQIVLCMDSTGKTLVDNGNGYYIGYDKEFKYVAEEGNVVSGARDGKWKGGYEYKNTKIKFNEEYKNGELITGQSTDETDQVYNYTVRNKQPQFIGGIEKFGRFLGTTARYPAEARRNNIQGKVIVSFVVEKDGTLSEFKILKNPDPLLSLAALQAMMQSPKWTPGLQYGRAVRVAYSVPVNFTLGTPYPR